MFSCGSGSQRKGNAVDKAWPLAIDQRLADNQITA